MSANLEKFRKALLSRGSASVKNICRKFAIMDDDRSRSLSLEEFTEGVRDFGLTANEMSNDDIKAMFKEINTNDDITISLDEFLKAVRGNLMNEARLNIVKKAFKVADKSGDGVLTVHDLQGIFNTRMHPKVKNGEWTETQAFEEFLRTFDTPNQADNKVTEEEFINYYTGLSASIDNDAMFDLTIRNAWKI
ncbi:calcyphosin-like protein [Tubulanus polymorphus]|uniref:calcyphosin-like protein n=1 Tax=Tubulanus polymorphus TaxID=672921 RepID=UPI003DA607C2